MCFKGSVICAVVLLLMAALWNSMLGLDSIDQLARIFSADPMWGNGMYTKLALPKTATAEEVIKKTFETSGVVNGMTEYKTLEVRKVRIEGKLPDIYDAALVETNLGRKIVLFQYSTLAGWWQSIYDADQVRLRDR